MFGVIRKSQSVMQAVIKKPQFASLLRKCEATSKAYGNPLRNQKYINEANTGRLHNTVDGRGLVGVTNRQIQIDGYRTVTHLFVFGPPDWA